MTAKFSSPPLAATAALSGERKRAKARAASVTGRAMADF
jgi:hypothetical protein